MKWSWVSLFGAFAACAGPALASEPPASDAFDAALVEADRRYTEGDLAGALSVLEPACAASERPECAFNLGAIHHGLGHCEQALAQYRRYRELAPSGEHLAEVMAALEEVEPRCGPATSAEPAEPGATSAATPAAPSAASTPSPPPPAPHVASPSQAFMVGSFVLSGVAAVGSVAFGVLAASSAGRCDAAQSYDRDYVEECEQRGPAYQGMWQGLAVASGGFLGIGLALWWFDARAAGSVGVSGMGSPGLQYRYRF